MQNTTSTQAKSGSRAGPSAHEDLTIAETIELMRVPDEHRPGEECFRTSSGEKRWVASSEVRRFIRRLGAVHPNEYEAEHGEPWEKDFFSGL